ncbi:MAG: tRNA uridine-5-carboxymethylaminomethyl(34) synthesis GTPase MnmE [Azospirillaceae bacterium]
MDATDTIYALASAPGRAGVAVVRVSGPGSRAIAEAVAGTLPPPRQATLRTLRDAGGAAFDQALVLNFPAPASFTGEDVLEIHIHGGRAVLAQLLDRLGELDGARPAEPGEFSRRAFLNGRLDLTEAEAIADLVDAETAAQARQALRQMSGALGALYDDWRGRLIRVLAHAEADLDFPDEDLPEGIAGALRPAVEGLAREMRRHLDDGGRGERLRHGVEVAIIGAPNVGKSSLLNALARRDVAIVSDIAGTTRDVLEVHLDLAGVPVIVADTAGLHEAAGDAVEQEGMRRARRRAETADLVIVMADCADARSFARRLTDYGLADSPGRTVIPVANKCDLAGAPDGDWLPVSVRTGEGLPRLLDLLGDRAGALIAGEAPPITRARHRQAVAAAAEALERALSAPLPELMAEDLRLAARALGRITGRVDVEEILDVVFRDFCIGK